MGHSSDSPYTLWLIFSSLTQFFLDLNVRVKNVVYWRSDSVEVAAKTQQLHMNAAYLMLKGVL